MCQFCQFCSVKGYLCMLLILIFIIAEIIHQHLKNNKVETPETGQFAFGGRGEPEEIGDFTKVTGFNWDGSDKGLTIKGKRHGGEYNNVSVAMLSIRTDMVLKQAYKVLTNLYNDRSLAKHCKDIFKPDARYQRRMEHMIVRLSKGVINPLVRDAMLKSSTSELRVKVLKTEKQVSDIALKHIQLQSEMYEIIGEAVKAREWNVDFDGTSMILIVYALLATVAFALFVKVIQNLRYLQQSKELERKRQESLDEELTRMEAIRDGKIKPTNSNYYSKSSISENE